MSSIEKEVELNSILLKETKENKIPISKNGFITHKKMMLSEYRELFNTLENHCMLRIPDIWEEDEEGHLVVFYTKHDDMVTTIEYSLWLSKECFDINYKS